MWLKKVSKKDIGATSCFNLELKSIAGELGILHCLFMGYQIVSCVWAIAWNRGAGWLEGLCFFSISLSFYANYIDVAIAIFVGNRGEFVSGFDF